MNAQPSQPFPIIDSHVHLWDPERFRISWTDNDPLLAHSYTLPQYHDETQGLPIEGIVFVECDVAPQYAFLEAQWAVNLAREQTLLKGIIAAAPIEFGARCVTYLEALRTLGPQIKGVRRNIQGEIDPKTCLQPDFVYGVQLLEDYSFTFDLCLRHWQLPAVIELVRLCPKIQFILDHLGKPPVSERQLDPWREQIQQLAALPNVACKISGLATEAGPDNQGINNLAPYIEHVSQTFGEDRILFGGDWPVILTASTYANWIGMLRHLCQNLSPTAQQKFWHENARRIYRLE
ncbi:amidohydrolase family protein [Ktedonospora formicarum]|uniref:Amidohydrolase n=1 Tax=Ktedonospora formicarum TaxID=2778364 RepID=A0A8J3MQE9_9CHLR|nr:amidohydrolase family protein [Ktedonospora formicarum]GHO42686.1 amidohydrolase [Ktedonospora formicarum]